MKNLIAILCFIIFPHAAYSSHHIKEEPVDAYVLKIVDGDTIHATINDEIVKMRLAFIDCPERNQPLGSEATEALKEEILDRTVKVHIFNFDRYGRAITEIIANNYSVNLKLVMDGKCFVYRRYAKGMIEYFNAETSARSQKKGVHSTDDFIKPWDWRKLRK